MIQGNDHRQNQALKWNRYENRNLKEDSMDTWENDDVDFSSSLPLS